jgi:hypothetical protein
VRNVKQEIEVLPFYTREINEQSYLYTAKRERVLATRVACNEFVSNACIRNFLKRLHRQRNHAQPNLHLVVSATVVMCIYTFLCPKQNVVRLVFTELHIALLYNCNTRFNMCNATLPIDLSMALQPL